MLGVLQLGSIYSIERAITDSAPQALGVGTPENAPKSFGEESISEAASSISTGTRAPSHSYMGHHNSEMIEAGEEGKTELEPEVLSPNVFDSSISGGHKNWGVPAFFRPSGYHSLKHLLASLPILYHNLRF